jgi:oligopeptide/dipeptide ABC transporter ATP-binding protein
MYLGRIVEEGPSKQIARNPQHPYTKALMSVVPQPDPLRRRRREILRGETPDPVHVPSGCRFHPRCPIAQDVCRTEDPALHPVVKGVTPDHRAACLFV